MPPPSITVLVVDDQDDMRLLVRTLITTENKGLSVDHEVSSGADAVEYLRDSEPTVVVLDHMMPGMTGLETARRILADRPEQPIVLFSAYLDERIVAEADAIGIRACVDKSDFRSVAAAVRSVASV
jgi:CheY-like chemotaxis protein